MYEYSIKSYLALAHILIFLHKLIYFHIYNGNRGSCTSASNNAIEIIMKTFVAWSLFIIFIYDQNIDIQFLLFWENFRTFELLPPNEILIKKTIHLVLYKKENKLRYKLSAIATNQMMVISICLNYIFIIYRQVIYIKLQEKLNKYVKPKKLCT